MGWMRHLALDATPHTPRAVLFMASVVTFISFFKHRMLIVTCNPMANSRLLTWA